MQQEPSFTLTATVSGSMDKLILRSAALRVLKGPSAGQQFEINKTPLVLGKGPSCDVVLKDPTVSTRHAEIVLRPNGYLIKDTGSRNGVWLGSCRVEGAYLAPGNVVKLGNVTLEVVDLKRMEEVRLSLAENFGPVMGRSIAMRRVFSVLETVAQSNTNVLFEGETGTGKTALAAALHQQGTRPDGPFEVFDCAATAANLLESELFGHQKGAFTGAERTYAGALERANGGTLFLDELGELSLDLQPKLLRAVETREVRRVGGSTTFSVDTRLIAATQHNLAHKVQSGEFRSDLFFRLAVVRVNVPPLRERLEDLPILLDHFARKLGMPAEVRNRFPDLLPLLRAYHWPGNVRELHNVVERLSVLPVEQAIPGVVAPNQPQATPAQELPAFSVARDQALEQFERAYTTQMLEKMEGNVTQAAEAAGVSRRYFTKLVAKHNLQRRRGQAGEE